MKHLPLIDCCRPLVDATMADDEAAELERLFRALGDRHRIKILNALARRPARRSASASSCPPSGSRSRRSATT